MQTTIVSSCGKILPLSTNTFDLPSIRNEKTKKKSEKDIGKIKRKLRNRQYVWDYLKEHPCVKCGESDPIVLEFNHKNPDDKTSNISDLMDKGMDRLITEIEKCDVMCANCHRKHTAKQFNHYRFIIK